MLPFSSPNCSVFYLPIPFFKFLRFFGIINKACLLFNVYSDTTLETIELTIQKNRVANIMRIDPNATKKIDEEPVTLLTKVCAHHSVFNECQTRAHADFLVYRRLNCSFKTSLCKHCSTQSRTSGSRLRCIAWLCAEFLTGKYSIYAPHVPNTGSGRLLGDKNRPHV